MSAGQRPLDAGEQALYDTVREAARGFLSTGAARLEVAWQRGHGEQRWPTFELRPRNPDALPLAVALGNDWIDTALSVDGEVLNFELWAPTPSERLARLRERITAVLEGRVDLRLRRERWCFLRAWAIVATFYLAAGPDETSRTPHGPDEMGHLFHRTAGDEEAGLIGPRSFPGYASS